VVKPPDSVLEVFLQPGDFYFGDRETRVRTLLGSCVAITVWHPQFLIGGMCHYLLPEYRQISRDNKLDGRYADEALQLFLHEIRNAGTHPCEYTVKMFGGSNQFVGHELKNNHNIPEKNIQTGKNLLQHHGFNLSSYHLGGNGHRNVMLDLWSGNVWVQHVNG
jgi:chemotaxis protein CheD